MRVFLGITGASGAPYAARLIQELGAAGAELGICISRSGYEVLATELYRDPSLPRDEIAARLLEGVDAHVFAENDWKAPYASGSAQVDAYVICPCSMSTVGTIAAGAMANLIHRAASVAIKERRKLVLVPRETPLSAIHLEALLTLRRAGALIMPAMPAFYTHPESVNDMIDFVAGRVLDLIGVEADLTTRWGS